MESFENFQDSNSSYGGLPIVDDTSSIVSGFTSSQNKLPADLESLSSLSISGDSSEHINHYRTSPIGQTLKESGVSEEDFDGVLDDLKDENAVELPPHACRHVFLRLFS